MHINLNVLQMVYNILDPSTFFTYILYDELYPPIKRLSILAAIGILFSNLITGKMIFGMNNPRF